MANSTISQANFTLRFTTTLAPEEATGWLDNRNNVATFIVLPAFVLFIGGCCSIYGCFQARRYCKRKRKERVQRMYDDHAMLAGAQKEEPVDEESPLATEVKDIEKGEGEPLKVEAVENFEAEQENLKAAKAKGDIVNLDTDSGIHSPKLSGRNSPNENASTVAAAQGQVPPSDANLDKRNAAPVVSVAAVAATHKQSKVQKVEEVAETVEKKPKKKKKKKGGDPPLEASAVVVIAAVVEKPKEDAVPETDAQEPAEKPKKAKKKKKDKSGVRTEDGGEKPSSARDEKKSEGGAGDQRPFTADPGVVAATEEITPEKRAASMNSLKAPGKEKKKKKQDVAPAKRDNYVSEPVDPVLLDRQPNGLLKQPFDNDGPANPGWASADGMMSEINFSPDDQAAREERKKVDQENKERLLALYVDPVQREKLSTAQVATAKVLAHRLMDGGDIKKPKKKKRVIAGSQ